MKGTVWLFSILGVFLARELVSTPTPVVKANQTTVNFNRQVKPILSQYCFKCHGPDAAELKGDLRLDLVESATKDRGGYKVVEPGNSKESELFLRITAHDYTQMPPEGSGLPKLNTEQIEILKAWIDQGAKYERHWSFDALNPGAIPVVDNKSWPRNAIDNYVLNNMLKNGLQPEGEAEKGALLRRAALSLTGLPPSEAELQMFLADNSKTAYESAVKRLLDSKRYGVHQARYWLDAVRYGDTHGLHLDNERAIHPYRDWVVRALNQDVPFDKMTQWQLAGDLMPNPTQDMMIATAFIRMNPTTNEGGAIVEEFQAKNTFDRVDTISTVYLGLTMACARCHDHKYDPLSQKDYFQMYAFFNSTKDEPLDGNALTPAPAIKAPTPEQSAALEQMKKKLATLVERTQLGVAKNWLKTAVIAQPTVGTWQLSEKFTSRTFQEAIDAKDVPAKWTDTTVELGKVYDFGVESNTSAFLRTTISTQSSGPATLLLRSDDGIKVWLNGAVVHDNPALRGITQGEDEVKIALKQGVNELQFRVTNGGGAFQFQMILGSTRDSELQDGLKKIDDPSSGELIKSLFLRHGPDSSAAVEYRKVSTEYAAALESVPFCLVAEELEKPRDAYILRRGEYDKPTEKVGRAIPEVFGKLPSNTPLNRLGFAQWLTSKENPLFARVFVNRIWQQHFGVGLVETSEDFGSQGTYPSNLALLDYLAKSFVDSGYSIKKLHFDIVTSSTFRQRSSAGPTKWAQDPANRFVARGPRFRLDAEVIRDQALDVAGLLNEQDGGRGFKPYQPPGLWEEIGFLDSNTSKYAMDMDDSIYKRSIYLFWKRTSPHPMMLAFDAPMRETCSVRRPRTNTPLQSLVTMNEPAFLEAAKFFGSRIQKQPGRIDVKIKWAYRIAFSREPKSEEVNIMTQAFARYRNQYEADPAGTEKLLTAGVKGMPSTTNKAELAAWMMVASTLINTDEFLTQH